MPISFARRTRPIGLPSLEQVQDIAEQAQQAAQAAADGAVALAQPVLDAAVDTATGAAATATASATAGQFSSRAEAAAATIPAPVRRIGALVGGRLIEWRDDPIGTSLTTADGRNWSPADVITPLHFGAVGGGAEDDAAAIEAALVWANAQPSPRTPVDGLGLTYGYGRTMQVNDGDTGLHLDNISLICTAAADLPLVNGMVGPAIWVYKARQVSFGNVYVDCNWRSSGILVAQGAARWRVSRGFHAKHWSRTGDLGYGFRTYDSAGDGYYEGGSTSQYDWGDAGFDQQSMRTGYGLLLETADCIVVGAVSSYSKYPIYKTGPGSWQLISPHVYNGAYAAGSTIDRDAVYGIYIDKTANGIITAPYIDNATLYINADDLHNGAGTLTLANAWNHYTGNASNRDQIRFVTSVTNNNMSGLSMHGVSVQYLGGAAIRMMTTGSGSYASSLLWKISGILSDSGIPAGINDYWSYEGAKLTSVTNGIELGSRKEITLMADYDANSGESSVYVGNDGVRNHRFTNRWLDLGWDTATSLPMFRVNADAAKPRIVPKNAAGVLSEASALTWDNTLDAWYIGSTASARRIQEVHAGTTAQRPANMPAGYTYYDTTLGALIVWSGSAWVTEAAGLSVSSAAAASRALPSEIGTGAQYWTASNGSPDVAGPPVSTSVIINGDGTITFPATVTSGNYTLRSRGVLPHIPGRVIRLTALVQARGTLPGGVRLRGALVRMDSAFATPSILPFGNLTPTALDVWQSLSTVTSVPEFSAVWLRVGLRLEGTVASGDIDVRSILIEDITTEQRSTGTTAARPTGMPAGWAHFDTTLGKPVWWTGAAWVDAVGAVA